MSDRPFASISPAPPVTELLAPAGDWECLRAAVANGADAVYFGLANFNARHRATNFSLDELPAVMEFLHGRNTRGYVTLNTLIFSDELDDVAKLVAKVSIAGADAVIVQDLGLARLIREVAPDLPIHGSTQMTLTEPRGIEIVRSLGVERVILARELSLAEIEKTRRATSLPVEVFVHGALCVAYSGQCLTSEALGGRSANRGQCAQACRLPYELIVDGARRDLGDYAYLLSPQDLSAHHLTRELVSLGVSALKIEGRLKSASYVAATTSAYRAALDAALADQRFKLSTQAERDLAQGFSRGFSPGFLEGVDHQRLVHGRFPKNRGVRVGTVGFVGASFVVVELADVANRFDDSAHDVKTIVKPGDGLVFDEGRPEQDEPGGRVVQTRWLERGRVEIRFQPGEPDTKAITKGALVWKTDDPEFRRRMQNSYARVEPKRRIGIACVVSGDVGQPLVIRATSANGDCATVTWEGPLAAARNQPLDENAFRLQFGRLGETPFELGDIRLEFPRTVMVPRSVLNDLRRQVVEQLLAHQAVRTQRRAPQPRRLAELRAESKSRPAPSRGAAPGPRLLVLVRNEEQLEGALRWSASAPLDASNAEFARSLAMIYCDFEDVRKYCAAAATARSAGTPIGLATLRIHKPGDDWILEKIAAAGGDAILVRSLASIAYFHERAPATVLIGDYALNVANDLTARFFRELGLARLTPSYDLNWEQFSALAARVDAVNFEIVVHQHVPMFHMEHCVFAATLSSGKDYRDCGRPCDTHRVELRDRSGAAFPLVADAGCRNTLFNSVAQSAAEYVPRMLALGASLFRVELLRETGDQVGPLLDSYLRLIHGLDSGAEAWRGLRILDSFGLTRGTLRV